LVLGTKHRRLNYNEYLQLDALLACQRPHSDEHDELLFVIIHQTTELWMKLCIHELRAVIQHVHDDDLPPAFKMLSRVGRVQSHLTEAWETLATMTPADYLRFRHTLGTASGLQSHQYRLIEFLLGAKDRAMLEMHRGEPAYAELAAAAAAPSLYDETLQLLARRGFDIPAAVTSRDWSLPYVANPAVEAAWLVIYHDVERYWDLYELAEKLVDLEYRFQKWRYAHLKTVERVIGFRRGTGGTAGAAYLATRLEKGFFPELFSLRTQM
jgi:tryptophan 2,3-dioxygenase